MRGRKNPMMNELYDACAQDEKDCRQAVEALDAKIRKHTASIQRLEKKRDKISTRGWVQMIVIPLAEKLAEHFGLKYEIYGPFGLRCETSIYLLADLEKGIVKSDTWGLTLTPHYDGEDNRTICYYETGEETPGYEPGSIGWLNGFNRVEAPLPDSFEEIVKLMRFLPGHEG